MATYTNNYQLHQWEASDSFLRTDFNADFAKIDAAIQAVEAAANTALAGKASLEALSAVQALAAARPQMAAGTYTGDGSEGRLINLGLRPKVLILAQGTTAAVMLVDGGPVPDSKGVHTIALDDQGFQVTFSTYNQGSTVYQHKPITNLSGGIYAYLALY